MSIYHRYSGSPRTPAYGSLDQYQLPPPKDREPAQRGYGRPPVSDYYQDFIPSDDDSTDSETYRRRPMYMSEDEDDNGREALRQKRKPTARIPTITPSDLRISPAVRAEIEAEQKRGKVKSIPKNPTSQHRTQEPRASSLPYAAPPRSPTMESTDSRVPTKGRTKPKPPSRRSTAESKDDSTDLPDHNDSIDSKRFIKEVTRNILGERFTRRSSSSGSTVRTGTYGRGMGV